jgi:hypothetical protein
MPKSGIRCFSSLAPNAMTIPDPFIIQKSKQLNKAGGSQLKDVLFADFCSKKAPIGGVGKLMLSSRNLFTFFMISYGVMKKCAFVFAFHLRIHHVPEPQNK